MKKLLLLLFCLIFIAGIGFSEVINLSGDITTAKELKTGNTYRIIDDINVSGKGYFHFGPSESAVTVQCNEGKKIIVDGATTDQLFLLLGQRFTLQNCPIRYIGGTDTNAVYLDTTGTTEINTVTFSGFDKVINIIQSGVLTISNITLAGNIKNFLYSETANAINGNINIKGLTGNSSGSVYFDGPVVGLDSGINLIISELSEGGLILMTGVTKKCNLSISNSEFSGIMISDSNIPSFELDDVEIESMALNITNSDNISNISNSKFGVNKNSLSNGRVILSGATAVFKLNLSDNVFANADSGLKMSESDLNLVAVGNEFKNVDTAYYLHPGKINGLSISGGTMTGVDTAIDAQNIFGAVSISALDPGSYSDMYFDNVNEKVDLSGTFASGKYPRFSNCSVTGPKPIKLGNFNFTIDDYGSFFDDFLDASCVPQFVVDSGLSNLINNSPFWMFNSDYSNYYPNKIIIDDDVSNDEFGIIMSYKAPIFIGGKTVGGIYLVGPYESAGISTNEIKYLKLVGDINTLIANNKISTDGIDCSGLSKTSKSIFNYDPANFKNDKAITGKDGLGGNYWYGFSDSATECKNENGDWFCDAKYSFECNGETYEDLYPLTLFTKTVIKDPDKTPGSDPGNKFCTKNSDCLGTESCISGKCADLNCKTGQVISNYACVDCLVDSQCPVDSKCTLNKCEKIACKVDEKVEGHKCVKLVGNAGLVNGTGNKDLNVDADVNKDIDVDVNKDIDADVNAPGTPEEPGFFQKLLNWAKDNKLILGIVGGIVVLLIIILIVVLVVLHNKKKKALLGEEPKEEPVEAEPEETESKDPKKEEEEPKEEDKDKSSGDEDSGDSENLDTSGWSK